MSTTRAAVKLNLGCGTNRLPGWDNHDTDVDISKPLPFSDGHADYILCEHCMEHIDYYAAVAFLKECRRVLRPGGVVRIATPSIERIRREGTQAYFNFTTKWQPHATAQGAMHAIAYCHGHRSVWTDSLLESTLFLAGYKWVTKCNPHASASEQLRDVDGHHRVIGEDWNRIETIVYEAAGE